MAEFIGFPAWSHSGEAIRAEWLLAREECERVARILDAESRGLMAAAIEREQAARERCLAVGVG